MQLMQVCCFGSTGVLRITLCIMHLREKKVSLLMHADNARVLLWLHWRAQNNIMHYASASGKGFAFDACNLCRCVDLAPLACSERHHIPASKKKRFYNLK